MVHTVRWKGNAWRPQSLHALIDPGPILTMQLSNFWFLTLNYCSFFQFCHFSQNNKMRVNSHPPLHYNKGPLQAFPSDDSSQQPTPALFRGPKCECKKKTKTQQTSLWWPVSQTYAPGCSLCPYWAGGLGAMRLSSHCCKFPVVTHGRGLEWLKKTHKSCVSSLWDVKCVPKCSKIKVSTNVVPLSEYNVTVWGSVEWEDDQVSSPPCCVCVCVRVLLVTSTVLRSRMCVECICSPG